MNRTLVKDYYAAQAAREWRRLIRDAYHRLEFDTTLHFLRKYLPPRGLVLDAGCGPGRYAIELAKSSFDVALLDCTAEMLDLANRQIRRAGVTRRVREVREGSLDDLSAYGDRTFDAVICLGGALGHLVDRTTRERAIDELTRVAKKGAPIFVSVISRMAVLVSELVNFPEEITIKQVFDKVRDTGDYRGGYGFAPSHFYLPEDLMAELKKRRVRILAVAGLEGLASGHRRETNRLAKKYPDAWKIWWETHLKTCTHPAAVGISEHFLVVGRK